MRGHRLERTIRIVSGAGLVAGMGMILVAGVVSIASAQQQLAAVPPPAVEDAGAVKGGGLDLHVPDMPFAQRPGAAKSARPDRWAWIEGCQRFVEARIARDSAIDWEIGRATTRIRGEDASYRRRHMLADCLAQANR